MVPFSFHQGLLESRVMKEQSLPSSPLARAKQAQSSEAPVRLGEGGKVNQVLDSRQNPSKSDKIKVNQTSFFIWASPNWVQRHAGHAGHAGGLLKFLAAFPAVILKNCRRYAG
jgi:hypothetical protein